MDERLVKERVQFSIQSVMYQSVPHARFVNIARFWVGYVEVMVAAVRVGFAFQFLAQAQCLIYQVILKFQDVGFHPLAAAEFLPGLQ